MTSYAIAEWTLDTVAANYTPENTPAATPVLVDDEDGTVYRITDAGGLEDLGRRYEPDPEEANLVTVDSSPDRQEEPIGTEYDLKVDDAVNVTVEGAHADAGGELSGPSEFESLYEEVRRAILVERTSYPTIGGTVYYAIVPSNPGRPPADEQSNYFAYEVDFGFSAYEGLP
ncbi:hypothetical protein U3A55_11910 [Salarchaeum sp. III]|uniref:hypothetical protein n=1 Tax=Salarchaeum sp. III TaxID=3107927 RepID=UPI002ED9A371